MSTPGENKIAIDAATAAGDLTDHKQGVTNVVAIADLKLDVSDPSGPVAVGQEAIYEIRVTNRGASAAEDVNVVGLFSAGLEPETGEGAPYTVSDGRVAFRADFDVGQVAGVRALRVVLAVLRAGRVEVAAG